MIVSADRAHWSGHFHCRTVMAWGVLEYGLMANDARIKQLLREFYEFTRNFGIARAGFFPAVVAARAEYPEGYQPMETCDLADMVCIAIGLCDGGVGDYWDDVDCYVRNHLVELQLLRLDWLEQISREGPEFQITPVIMTDDRVVERNIGAFARASDPTILYPNWTTCCSANGAIALAKAWEAIVRYRGGVAQVSLLLNRASPWVDIDSYLPYEGKVVLRNKRARSLRVRIPLWVDKCAVRCRAGERSVAPDWLGNYLIVDGVEPEEVVTLEFPMVETTERWTDVFYGPYTCRFRGNTFTDISPRSAVPAIRSMGQDDGMTTQIATGYCLYQREHYRADKAPMKPTIRFVSSALG